MLVYSVPLYHKNYLMWKNFPISVSPALKKHIRLGSWARAACLHDIANVENFLTCDVGQGPSGHTIYQCSRTPYFTREINCLETSIFWRDVSFYWLALSGWGVQIMMRNNYSVKKTVFTAAMNYYRFKQIKSDLRFNDPQKRDRDDPLAAIWCCGVCT